MKIVIPINENNMQAGVCQSFGRAPFFLIYDTQSKEEAFIDNKAANSSGGAGIIAAQVIVDNQAAALLTPRCGQNAAEVLEKGGVKLYKTKNDSIEENIEAFIKEELSLLSDIHEGFHKRGGQ